MPRRTNSGTNCWPIFRDLSCKPASTSWREFVRKLRKTIESAEARLQPFLKVTTARTGCDIRFQGKGASMATEGNPNETQTPHEPRRYTMGVAALRGAGSPGSLPHLSS